MARELVERAGIVARLLSERITALQHAGEWHPGTDHGEARYVSDARELDAIAREDIGALCKLYPGTVPADWEPADASELIARIVDYWGLTA